MMAVPNSGWIHSCPVGEYLASIACTCKQLDEVPRPPSFRKISLTRSGVRLSLVPRPHPSAREKGLVTIARFLLCAESAVLNSRKPIRLHVLDLSCDKQAIA